MPRPLNNIDITGYRISKDFRVFKVQKLGWCIEYLKGPEWNDDKIFSYQADNSGLHALWITRGTFERRKKLGHPPGRKRPGFKQRKKPILPPADFSLDEMELATNVMEALTLHQRD